MMKSWLAFALAWQLVVLIGWIVKPARPAVVGQFARAGCRRRACPFFPSGASSAPAARPRKLTRYRAAGKD